MIERISPNVILHVFISGKDYSKGSSLVCCKQDVEKCMICSDSKIDGCLDMLSKRYSECDGKTHPLDSKIFMISLIIIGKYILVLTLQLKWT